MNKLNTCDNSYDSYDSYDNSYEGVHNICKLIQSPLYPFDKTPFLLLTTAIDKSSSR